MAIPWSLQEATPKQIEAISSYEKVTKTTIHYKNKQDASDVICQFCRNGITFKDGFIEGTKVAYTEQGKSVDGGVLSNNPLTDTLRPRYTRGYTTADVLGGLSRAMNNMEDDDSFEAGGADPYFMFY